MGVAESMKRLEISKQPRSETAYFEVSKRRFRNAAYRTAQEPLTGPFYWVPHPDDSWHLDVHFDIDYGEFASHENVWPQTVLALGIAWGKKEPDKLQRRLSNAIYGLPRGRVVKMESPQSSAWGIAHGADAPVLNAELLIRDAYCLRGIRVKMYHDEHEATQDAGVKLIEEELKRRFKLRPQSTEWDG